MIDLLFDALLDMNKQVDLINTQKMSHEHYCWQ